MSPHAQRAYAPVEHSPAARSRLLPSDAPLSRRALKRAIDVVGALIALCALLPVMLVLAIAIRLVSPGPVLFRQRRLGRHGRAFLMLKLRTMRVNAEAVLRADRALYAEYLANQCKIPPHRDPRITRLGRWLRVTSLDELPQFWNVLRGDMSLVGPRPLIGPELSAYGDAAETLLSVRPGMTGLWQVSGRSALAARQRVRLDLAYARMGARPGVDLAIMARTIPAVLFRRGAH